MPDRPPGQLLRTVRLRSSLVKRRTATAQRLDAWSSCWGRGGATFSAACWRRGELDVLRDVDGSEITEAEGPALSPSLGGPGQ